MPLPRSADVSSSTLGLSGMETPVHHPLSPPPLKDVERYEKRALPPVPLKRDSGVSAFSKEVDDALATPEPAITPEEGSIYFMLYHETASDNGDNGIVSTAGKQTGMNQKKKELKVNTGGVARGQFDTPISPQPKSSIGKVYQISGVQNVPTFRETTPTGHNSEKKIQKLTGLGVPPELVEQQKQIRAEQKKQLHGEISPLSDNGSDYISEDPKTAVSDPEGDTETGREYSSEPSSAWFSLKHSHRHSTGSASVVPRPLRVVKAARPDRSSERIESPRHDAHSPGLAYSSRAESEQASPTHGQDTRNDKSSPDLYHEAAKQLAKEDARAAQHSRRGRPRQLAARQFLQVGGTSSADDYHTSKGRESSHLPRQHRQHNSPNGRPSGSTERVHPIWRPSNLQQNSPRAVSADTFGRLPHRFYTQHSPSPSASPRPDPRPCSAFDYDSDTNDNNNHTIGTPDTGGSIPISIASDIVESTNPEKTPRRRLSSHSNSIIAKVFRKSSLTATPPPTSTPVHSSPATPRRQTRQPYDHDHNPTSNPNPSTNLPPQFHFSPAPGGGGGGGGRGRRASAGPGDKAKLGPETSVSATLAAKAADLVGAAAGFLSKSSHSFIGLSGEERRKRRLKSRIRVLADGGQVWNSEFGSGSGSGSGLGPGSGSGSGLMAGSGFGSVGSLEAGGGGLGRGGAGFRGRLGSAPAGPATFWAGQAGDGSVWGKGFVQSPGMGRDGVEGRRSPRLGHGRGAGSDVGMGRESPRPSGQSGNGHGSGGGLISAAGLGISPHGSPRPQEGRAVRGDSPRSSPQPSTGTEL